MFTDLDNILYPERCEVIEVASQLFVYPIFKNATTTLYDMNKDIKGRILLNAQIKKCEKIRIYIREPRDRLAAGINQFYLNLLSKADMHDGTIRYFIENYIFLDRHYMPQFLHLINLAQHLQPGCELEFIDLTDLNQMTDKRLYADIPRNFLMAKDFYAKPAVNYYLTLDKILYDRCGSVMTWKHLIHFLISEHRDIYNLLTTKRKTLLDVLSTD
jgi:hypothetical protein